jgi:hypothetical protein
VNLLSAATAYLVLQKVIIRQEGPKSPLRQALGTDTKGKISVGLNVVGIFSALLIDRSGHTGVGIALACFVGIAIIWFIPDRRIGGVVEQYEAPD